MQLETKIGLQRMSQIDSTLSLAISEMMNSSSLTNQKMTNVQCNSRNKLYFCMSKTGCYPSDSKTRRLAKKMLSRVLSSRSQKITLLRTMTLIYSSVVLLENQFQWSMQSIMLDFMTRITSMTIKIKTPPMKKEISMVTLEI